MRTIAIRLAGILLLLLALLLQPDGVGLLGQIAWTTGASVVFAAVMIYFTNAAHTYVLSSVVAATAVSPLIVLFAIGQPTYVATDLVGQLAEFTSKLASSLSGHYAQAVMVSLLPTVACAAVLRTLERLALGRPKRPHASA
jgi:hypothetical protein